ncbi:MAG: bifunctional GTP diphosphokinase/guanosine-3',5'-bis(diphosphate) 3'-diphosphatase [Piscirickettsiaceae bacterium]|nr:MAG: bifunctional GTP diphosphokinase/guanosine-3',5'-bis(diphosphate) 3'-diphosphatase [Piscirickettsiaceae bacterium]
MTATSPERPALLQDDLMQTLIETISVYMSDEQISLVKKAYTVGSEAHSGQRRMSGEDYICHPISVALILTEMKMDADCIVAAILHDVIEDTDRTFDDLESMFNVDVATLVDAVTKLTQIDFKSRKEAQAENMRKMFLAMAKDLRVIVIKLADRLHNMRTIGVMRPNSKRRIARETLDIYAPIAHRLGMHDFRLELEDLSFNAMFPRRREVLAKSIKAARGNRKEVVEKIQDVLIDTFNDTDFAAVIKGREKNLYSIYHKMKSQRISFSEVYDVYAFRVIVSSVDECYRAIGILHGLYKPIPGKFKDYIALPKSNGYQSLHTILAGPYGVPIELQVRTLEMDRLAESGIAAHWLYKTEGAVNAAQSQAHEWLRNLLEMQKASDDSYEFIDTLKVDLFPQEVYVFTPKGKIIKLPRGATAVDFAFFVHTDVGMTCAGAKINRRLEPLHTPLRNGQTVDIITSDFAVCNPNWLNFVVTAKARNAIRHHLKEFKERDAIALGGQLLDAEFSEMNMSLGDVPAERVDAFLNEHHLASLDGLLLDIGFGNRMPLLVVHQLIGNENTGLELGVTDSRQSSATMTIHGAEGLSIVLAPCCRPILGDKIIGFFSPGRGVVVHRIHCKNTRSFKKDHKSWLNVQWDDEAKGSFSTDIKFESKDQKGVFAHIASILSSYGCNIENVDMAPRDGGTSIDIFTVTVDNRKHLARVMRRLRAVSSIIKISRVRN